MLQYLKGDATQPVGHGKKYIVHVCNDKGGWGAGFVLAISRRWKTPEREYRSWASARNHSVAGPFTLGRVQFVDVGEGLSVVNMIAQHGYADRLPPGQIPLDYDALETCLARVSDEALADNASIHMPRIGCGLAGGRWDRVGLLVERCLAGLDVFVYDF